MRYHGLVSVVAERDPIAAFSDLGAAPHESLGASRLSSVLTFIYKVVLPSFWIGAFTLATAFLIIRGRVEALICAGGTLLGLAVAWVHLLPLKKVAVTLDTLIVSNYRRTIVIPLGDVESIFVSVINIRTTTIALRTPSPFGRRIKFMPRTSFTLFGTPPAVELLEQRVQAVLGAAQGHW